MKLQIEDFEDSIAECEDELEKTQESVAKLEKLLKFIALEQQVSGLHRVYMIARLLCNYCCRNIIAVL